MLTTDIPSHQTGINSQDDHDDRYDIGSHLTLGAANIPAEQKPTDQQQDQCYAAIKDHVPKIGGSNIVGPPKRTMRTKSLIVTMSVRLAKPDTHTPSTTRALEMRFDNVIAPSNKTARFSSTRLVGRFLR